MIKENVDVLVIGAGPSGTVAASMVRQKGFNVKRCVKSFSNYPKKINECWKLTIFNLSKS